MVAVTLTITTWSSSSWKRSTIPTLTFSAGYWVRSRFWRNLRRLRGVGRDDRHAELSRCAGSWVGAAGPRIAEALDLRERHVRLHDPAASRLWIADSKTETGIRYVEVTPALRDILIDHCAQKIRRGYPTHPDARFFCTHSGTSWDDGNVRERILRGGRAGQRKAHRKRPAALAARHAAHDASHLRLDRAPGL